MRTLGAVLAGGRSSRFGSDKAEAVVGGRTLLAHAIDALRAQCDDVVVVGRVTSTTVAIPDWPEPGLGPLGGLAGALIHAHEHGFGQVLSAPVDCLALPATLVAVLAPAPACLAAMPVIGLWPVVATRLLQDMLRSEGSRAMRRFAAAIGARTVDGVGDIANFNTPADLAAWERLYA